MNTLRVMVFIPQSDRQGDNEGSRLLHAGTNVDILILEKPIRPINNSAKNSGSVSYFNFGPKPDINH